MFSFEMLNHFNHISVFYKDTLHNSPGEKISVSIKNHKWQKTTIKLQSKESNITKPQLPAAVLRMPLMPVSLARKGEVLVQLGGKALASREVLANTIGKTLGLILMFQQMLQPTTIQTGKPR